MCNIFKINTHYYQLQRYIFFFNILKKCYFFCKKNEELTDIILYLIKQKNVLVIEKSLLLGIV